jgi:hypothetical protein
MITTEAQAELGVNGGLLAAFAPSDQRTAQERQGNQPPKYSLPHRSGASTRRVHRIAYAGEVLVSDRWRDEFGDEIPPAVGALDAYTPPMYIVMVMKPTGDYALNKMMAFLIAHLEIFSPAAKVPKWIEVLQGVTSHVVTFTGYQYNQRGDLVPVPRQFYNDRYFAPRPVVLEDQKGSPLATLQFLPW